MVDAQHDHHANGYEDAAHDGFGPLGDGAQAIRAFSDRFAGAKADDKYQDRNAEGKEDHNRQRLSHAFALRRERNGATQRRTDAGRPDCTQQDAANKLAFQPAIV